MHTKSTGPMNSTAVRRAHDFSFGRNFSARAYREQQGLADTVCNSVDIWVANFTVVVDEPHGPYFVQGIHRLCTYCMYSMYVQCVQYVLYCTYIQYIHT
jgi:hypothetical protein